MNVRGDQPDVCIVGAGLAGGLIAYELARRGVTTVVLEAGPRHDPARRFEYLERYMAGDNPWLRAPGRDAYTTAGEIDYPLNRLRVKGVGGSTLHWTALTHRLHASDFAARSRYGLAADWPISYETLEPYYGRAEQLLAVAGVADNPFASRRAAATYPLPPFPFSYSDEILAAAAARRGIAFHHAPFARGSVPHEGRAQCLAFGTCTSHQICPINAQYTAETHVQLAEATGRARVVTGAQVVRLNCDTADRLRSVTYVDAEGRQQEQPARAFVLAAHGIESARLLLLSRSSRFPDGLANRSGMVGRNFIEHPLVSARGRMADNLYPYRIGFHTAETHQFCDTPQRAESSPFRLALLNRVGPTPSEIAALSGQWGAALRDEVRAEFGHYAGLQAILEQLPDAGNTITLDPAVVDDLGDPVPRITYRVGAYERAGRLRAIARMEEILAAAGARDIESSFADEFAMCGHEIGMCRMGADPDTSVVDADLRAHDVANLYLAGSSVFVTAGPLNPSLTIAALALRLAEFLAAHGA